MKIACIQCTSADSVAENITHLAPRVAEAAAQGAQLVALPENAFLMATGAKFHEQSFAEAEHPSVLAACDWAVKGGLWLLIGSIAVATGRGRYVNRSLLISPEGKIAARYDKIHLFDVSIPDGESHQESKYFDAGAQAVVAKAGEAALGLSICYDVRFPYLYRALAKAGAQILTIPAAFTRFTGQKGGWHVLCRARAMETGCYVMAPAQCGEHASGRQTYGHSLIIDPWGEVLAEAGEGEETIYAEIDLAKIAKTRQIMPSLTHDKEFKIP